MGGRFLVHFLHKSKRGLGWVRSDRLQRSGSKKEIKGGWLAITRGHLEASPMIIRLCGQGDYLSLTVAIDR